MGIPLWIIIVIPNIETLHSTIQVHRTLWQDKQGGSFLCGPPEHHWKLGTGQVSLGYYQRPEELHGNKAKNRKISKPLIAEPGEVAGSSDQLQQIVSGA